MQLKLKPIFLKRKSFDEYMERGIEIVKKYPNIGLNSLG
ncbi:MAG: HEM-1/HEM-2 family protein [Candidatus Marsarchaeota archaeon]|nr:HEM-1/HEM-2 family protein [Candidatus Marsarchaeota archaeon]